MRGCHLAESRIGGLVTEQRAEPVDLPIRHCGRTVHHLHSNVDVNSLCDETNPTV